MAIDFMKAPFPVTYRELWVPRSINGNATLPSSRHNGHALTLTGAKLGTTADGVHFDGTLNSNINCGAIHNAEAKLWLSFRFKLDQAHVAGSASKYFMIKANGGESIYLYLSTVDGALHFTYDAAHFAIATVVTTWNAGQAYHVIASISSAAGVRLRVDNGGAVTNANLTAFPAAGNLYLGNPAGTSHVGLTTDIFIGTDDLTAAEETDLFNGIPPADATEIYLHDEGRGVTTVNRGSSGAGANGTLGSACTWAYGQVQQPVLSLNNIGDVGASSVGVDISGNISIIWVGKIKSTYNSLTGGHSFYRIHVDNNNEIYLYYSSAGNVIQLVGLGSGAAQSVNYTGHPAIDDYMIFIGTLTGGLLSFYVNGSLIGSTAGVGAILAGGGSAYLGRLHVAADYDISKPLVASLIDGAFTAQQVLAYSRWLRDMMNLPISM